MHYVHLLDISGNQLSMLSFFFFPVESVFLREAGQLAANAPAPALDVSRRLQSKALLLYHRRKAHHPAGKQRSKNNLIRLQLCWIKGFSAEFISDGTEGIGDQTQNMNLLHLLFVFVCIFFSFILGLVNWTKSLFSKMWTSRRCCLKIPMPTKQK